MNSARSLFAIAVLAGAFTLACNNDAAPASPADKQPSTAAETPSDGGSVTVPQRYAPPADRVPSTGASIPVNGKPTLVFVDAIW